MFERAVRVELRHQSAWLIVFCRIAIAVENRFDSVVKTFLCMEGRSLINELMKRFGCRADTVNASAFVQQRGKILSETFETVFRMLAKTSDTNRLYNGYRLFAVDGPDIPMPTNP